jgi:hypothetical protein
MRRERGTQLFHLTIEHFIKEKQQVDIEIRILKHRRREMNESHQQRIQHVQYNNFSNKRKNE